MFEKIDTNALITLEKAAAKVGCSVPQARLYARNAWAGFAGKVGKPWLVSEPHLDDWIRSQMAASRGD